jgi:CheY-like chemotaxis protein
VAEDSADNRLLVSAYLRHEPHLLDFAENGQIAVEKFMTQQYDMVLMDIQMPQLDGLGATQIIRKWETDQGRAATPIIALTASSAMEEDVRRIIEAGCDMHVSKPVKKSVLLAAIRDAAVPRQRSASDPAVPQAIHREFSPPPRNRPFPASSCRAPRFDKAGPHPEAVASDEEVVMMLSSDDLRPEFTRLQELGLDAFLVKPITRKELFRTIRRVIPAAFRIAASAAAPDSASLTSAPDPDSISRTMRRLIWTSSTTSTR